MSVINLIAYWIYGVLVEALMTISIGVLACVGVCFILVCLLIGVLVNACGLILGVFDE